MIRKAALIFFAIVLLPLGATYFNSHFSGTNLLAQGDDQAIAHGCADAMLYYVRAVEYGAGSVGYARRGLCRSRLKQYDEALKDWAESSKIDPVDPYPYLLRANLLQRLGRTDEALQAYDQAVAVNDKGVDSRLLRANFLQKIGKFDLASAAYKELMVRKDEPLAASTALFEYAAIQLIEGKSDDAFATVNDGLAQWPDNALGLYERGILELFARNQPENAAADLSASIVAGTKYRMLSILLAKGTVESRVTTDNASYYANMEPFLPIALQAILFLDVARSRSKQPGSEELKKNFEDIAFALRPTGSLQPAKLVGWPIPIVRYFLNEINEDELMAEAETASVKTAIALCSANLFAGLFPTTGAPKDAEQRYLRAAMVKCPTTSIEWRLAAQEVQRRGL